MSQTEYEAAISDFLRSKGVTRCPTTYVAPTYGSTAETDRAALREYENALEAARLQKRERGTPSGHAAGHYHGRPSSQANAA